MLLGIFSTFLLITFIYLDFSYFIFIALIYSLPIIYFLLPLQGPVTSWVTLLVLLCCFIMYLPKKLSIKNFKNEILFLWPILYGVFYLLCLHHSDFYSIGERFRDFAILGQVKNNFVHPNEPWFSGHELGYYLYWYRLGAYFSHLLNLATSTTYHSLLSFTFASAFLAFYSLLIKRIKLEKILALTISILMFLGANGAGLIFLFLSKIGYGVEWWSMTRVIKGTINEFPSWSFVLGDLHPHFCNLGAILLFWEFLFTFRTLTLPLILFSISAIMFWRNTNPWELPLILISLFLFYIINCLRNINFKKRIKYLINSLSKKEIYLCIYLFILFFSLTLSSLNLPAAKLPIQLVSEEWRTDFRSFLLHWSWPFLIIAIFRKKNLLWITSTILIFLISYFLNIDILYPFLFFLFAEIYFISQEKYNWSSTCLILLWIGLIFPELFFFDDAYGGPNERMNTIFKFYFFLWPILFLIFSNVIKEFNRSFKMFVILVSVPLSLVFFLKLNLVRRPFPTSISLFSSERERGLEALEFQFKGASEMIDFLSLYPNKILLEGTTQAYTWSSHLASLSGLVSYLGWDNHISLLTREYVEVGRRLKVIHNLYTMTSCLDRKELMKKEAIDFLVVGQLEKEKFPELNSIIPVVDFTCLNNIKNSGGYSLYSI